MTEQRAEKEKLLPRLRREHPWLDHVVRAGEAYTDRNGNHYAAAITYFSVLSLFPLFMIAFSIAAFILAGNQVLLDELKESIISSAPSGLGNFLTEIVDAALDSRTGIGIFGLLLAFYSGIGWMSNLRDALTAQWGQESTKSPFLSSKLKDLLALFGLGLALAVSFGLTAVGSGLGQRLLVWTGLEDNVWAELAFQAGTVVLSLAANFLVFLWVISRLPRQRASARSALRGAVLAAILFEILKQGAALYLEQVSSSPSGALFGPIIGLLVFANLVSRFLLFITAWTATARENIVEEVEPPAPAVIRPEITVRSGPGAGSVAGAFGVGAVLGWLARRRR